MRTQNPQTSSVKVNVNGMSIHVEQHGAGKPLLVLHGGIMPDCFGPNLPALAAGRRVIAPHLQGHGHTKDIDRALRREALADDMAALVRELGLGKVDVLGYSFGGAVALQMAIRHPDLVDRLVLVSTAMAKSGFFPEVRTAFDNLAASAPHIAGQIAKSPMGAMYPGVAWESLFQKVGELASRDFDFGAQVAAIKLPTQLIFADADAVSLEHIAAFYKALGGGQRDAGLDGSLRTQNRLAIVPGTSHYNILGTTAVAGLANGFLS